MILQSGHVVNPGQHLTQLVARALEVRGTVPADLRLFRGFFADLVTTVIVGMKTQGIQKKH